MGILRSVGKGVGGFIFTTSLAGLIFAIALVNFTDYESLKSIFIEVFSLQTGRIAEQVGPSVKGEVSEKEIEEKEVEYIYQGVLEMCEGNESIELPISESGETITIDCNEVRQSAEAAEGEGKAEAIGQVIAGAVATSFFESVYYKEYDCDFVGCIETAQLGVMLSVQGHEFFEEILIYLAAGIAAGVVLILISAERWSDRLKSIGWPLVLTGLSYVLINFGKGAIASNLPGPEQVGIDVMPIVDRMVAPMMNTFLISLIIGIVLTAGGYGLAYKEKKEAESGKPAKKVKPAKTIKSEALKSRKKIKSKK